MTNTSTRQLIYLAAPYTNDDPEIQLINEQSASEAAAQIAIQWPNVFPYSPISYGCAIATHLPEEQDHGWWMDMCWPIFNVCDEIWVLCLNGRTAKSEGVRLEIDRATRLRKRILFVTRPNPTNEALRLSDTPPNFEPN